MTEVSVYITDEMLAKRMTDNYDIPYLSLKSEEFPRLNVRNGWMKVSNVYTAKGGEKYVYIGNFKGANDAILKKQMNNVTLYVEKISSLTNKLEGVSKYGEAMYMYDNLEVIPIESTIIPKAVDYYLTNKTISAEKTDPIYFDSGKALLREESFRILEKVGDFLFENPEYRLEIHAHTDSDGKAKANQKLSLSRAKAAKAYLVSAGISPKRISTKWFAEKKPAVENKDENAKQLNRRVEFVFIKKK
jgi:outer membrane protein OmpA-like peptidoglycan-associated protein